MALRFGLQPRCGLRMLCGRWLPVLLGLVCLGSFATSLRAEASAPETPVPALLLSDFHLDPYSDPAKVKQLDRAPVSQWQAILSAPASPRQAQDAIGLQENCPVRGMDTPYSLFRSSLDAMRTQKPAPKFVTVSGDLISHNFKCRYRTLLPNAAPGAYEVFVEKTIQFVSEQVRAAFPGVPVYIALGNNDAGCEDYRMDMDSAFLADVGRSLSAGLPEADRPQAQKDLAAMGNYSAALPMPKARIVVIDDIFLSGMYENCKEQPDPHGALRQMDWLEAQLADARAHGEHVWVMTHIPPGVDVFSTMIHFRAVCHGESPMTFMHQWLNDRFIGILMKYGDVVRLTQLAHTHMDEMHLLNPQAGEEGVPVAVKMVPSISPINGNAPSFTLASVDPATATLKDYRVIVSSNNNGVGAQWSQEYDFADTYHVNAYTPELLTPLLDGMEKDSRGQTPAAHAYIHNYYAGGRLPAIGLFWTEYRCSLVNATAKGYAACECAK